MSKELSSDLYISQNLVFINCLEITYRQVHTFSYFVQEFNCVKSHFQTNYNFSISESDKYHIRVVAEVDALWQRLHIVAEKSAMECPYKILSDMHLTMSFIVQKAKYTGLHSEHLAIGLASKSYQFPHDCHIIRFFTQS